MATGKSVFTNSEVAGAIAAIVDGAGKEVVLVSPYLKLWNTLESSLTFAAKRNISLT